MRNASSGRESAPSSNPSRTSQWIPSKRAAPNFFEFLARFVVTGCYSSALVLTTVLFTTICFPSASTAETPRYHAGYACEGDLLQIGCEPGHYIHLVRANFGRFSIEKCNDGGNSSWATDCMSHRSVRVLHSLCSKRERCEVFANATMFGDPCPGSMKYLEAHYQCFPDPLKVKNADVSMNQTSPSDGSNKEEKRSVEVGFDSEDGRELGDANMTVSMITNATLGQQEGKAVATGLLGVTESSRRFSPASSNASSPMVKISERSDGSVNEGEEKGRMIPTSQRLPLRFGNRPSSSPSPSAKTASGVSPCPAQKMRFLTWNWTAPGDVTVQSCPPGSSPGLARWTCTGPAWESPFPDLSDCRSLWLGSALTRVTNGHSLDAILNEVRTVTSSKSLFGGDLRAVADLVKEAARRLHGKDVKEVSETIGRVMGIGSDVIAPEQAAAWDDMPHAARGRAATDLLLALEDNAFVLADGLAEDRTVLLPELNILMSAQKVRPSGFPVLSFPTDEESKVWNLDDGTSIHVPGKALVHNWRIAGLGGSNSESSGGSRTGSVGVGAAVKIVFFLMNNLDRALAPSASLARPANTVVGSRVISASVDAGRHVQLSYPVTIVFRNLRAENVTRRYCVFWDYTTSSWSEEGCTVVQQNRTYTVCECSHLTHFAVLMARSDGSGGDGDYVVGDGSRTLALIEWLTSAALSLSIAGFFAAFVLTHVWKNCRGEKWAIYQNFCACVLVGQLIFVLGIRETWNPIGCGVVAGLLHYFFLAAFVWAFIQEFDLYMSLVELAGLETKRRTCMIWYAVVAYGVPLVIVGVAAAVDVSYYSGSGKLFSSGAARARDFCWIGAGNFAAIAFAGPVGVLLIAAMVVIAMSMLLSSKQAETDGVGNKRRYQSAGSPPVSLSLSSAMSSLDWRTSTTMSDSQEGMVEDKFKKAAMFAATRKWIFWTLGFTVFFVVTWTLGFLSVSTFAPKTYPRGDAGDAGSGKSWSDAARTVNICFAVCQVLLGLFAVLLTAILAGKMALTFRRKFPFCQVCFGMDVPEDELSSSSMRFAAGCNSGFSGAGDDDLGGAGAGMLSMNRQRAESARRKRGGEGGIMESIAGLAGGQGVSMAMVETGSSQMESGGMNYYITTLKNVSTSSGAGAIPAPAAHPPSSAVGSCAHCPHPYCDAGGGGAGGEPPVPAPAVGGLQLQPLPPLPRPYCQDVGSVMPGSTAPGGFSRPGPRGAGNMAAMAAVVAMRAHSPGNHTYMELELNADGSTIYAEIDHNHAKTHDKMTPPGQRVESGYEYARGVVSRGQFTRKPVQMPAKQYLPPPHRAPPPPAVPVGNQDNPSPGGVAEGGFLLNNLNRSPTPGDCPASSSSSFSTNASSSSPDSNLTAHQQQQRRSRRHHQHRNVRPPPHSHAHQLSQDGCQSQSHAAQMEENHRRQRSHSGNISRPASPSWAVSESAVVSGSMTSNRPENRALPSSVAFNNSIIAATMNDQRPVTIL